MTSRTHDMESYIHNETLKDILSAWLYSTTVVHDDEDILSISIGPPNKDGVRPLKYKTRKQREVELIVHS